MQDKELLFTLCAAYRLGETEKIKQIHAGTNSVYQLGYWSGGNYQQLAVKVSSSGETENAMASKQTEKSVLERLSLYFQYVPKLISPVQGTDNTQCYSWGLLWKSTQLISVYQWEPSLPYCAIEAQLINTGVSFSRLQKALSAIDTSDLATLKPIQESALVNVRNGKPGLVENSSINAFKKFIKCKADICETSQVILCNLIFLEDEIAAVRNMLKQYGEEIKHPNLSLVHQQLSPSNFGYDKNHQVTMVFDFDSLSLGLPIQDLAWLVATFCVDYRKDFKQITSDVTTLLSTIQLSFPLDVNYSDYLIPFMRLAYLDTIYRKIWRASKGIDNRMGFVKEDIFCLHWLRKYEHDLNLCLQQL